MKNAMFSVKIPSFLYSIMKACTKNKPLTLEGCKRNANAQSTSVAFSNIDVATLVAGGGSWKVRSK